MIGQPPAYDRMETWLLRAFDGIPKVEVPPSGPDRKPHIFELRNAETPNLGAQARKIEMWNKGEIQVFRTCRLNPLFFGETLSGVENAQFLVHDLVRRAGSPGSSLGCLPEGPGLGQDAKGPPIQRGNYAPDRRYIPSAAEFFTHSLACPGRAVPNYPRIAAAGRFDRSDVSHGGGAVSGKRLALSRRGVAR